MTNTYNTTAKIAAVLAGLALVGSSFAAFAPAARAQSTTDLQAQINALLAQIAALQGNTGTTAAVTFTQDLTLGSSGAQVTALQNWLISKGYAIAAGATGYFGAQTQAALAKYQAAEGISPASGYFGPITRAKVNASAGGSTGGNGGSTGGNTGGDLSGGEANLTDYELRSEESEGNEGEEGVEIATAEFDVEDGDVRVERVEIEFDAVSGSYEDQPWQYFDTLYLWVDGEEVADLDVSDRDEWDETTDDVYEVVFTGLDYVVEEGDMASITIAADIAQNIDTTDLAQDFDVSILDEGIRAVDSEGIQQYIGQDTDTVRFGFGEEENGDLSIRESDENPDAANLKVENDETSEEYTVFAFDIRNTEDVDSLLTELTIDTTISGTTTTDRVIRNATLVVDGDEYDGDIQAADDGNIVFDDLDVLLAGDETTSFELMVEFTAQVGNYASGDTVRFDVAPADIEAEGDESGDSVEVADISGAADSELHTLSLTGFMVEAVSTAQAVTTTDPLSSSYGTYTIKFDVTADEDDPIYVDDTASNSSSTAAVVFNILGSSYTGTTSATLVSTADMTSGVYRVDAGDTETFTLTVVLDPSAAGQYRVEVDTVRYGTSTGASAYALTYDVSTDDADFETDNINIPN